MGKLSLKTEKNENGVEIVSVMLYLNSCFQEIKL